MDQRELKDRTKAFALRIIRLSRSLPADRAARVIADQVLRSGTSVAANYRAACRARSPAEFIAKLGVVEEEADEACFWLELIVESALMPPRRISSLLEEADQLVAIMAAARKSAKARATRRPQRAPRNSRRAISSAIGNRQFVTKAVIPLTA